MILRELSLTDITDQPTKRAFEVLRDILVKQPLINSNFRLFELSFSTNGTFLVAHGFGYKPKDVIQTSNIGGAAVWNFTNFTSTDLSVTISGVSAGTPCVIRAVIGRYEEGL